MNSSSASRASIAGEAPAPAASSVAAKRKELSIQLPESPSATAIFITRGRLAITGSAADSLPR
jgi:hypothetical protein